MDAWRSGARRDRLAALGHPWQPPGVRSADLLLASLGYANMTVAQIEAIAKADLTAAQLTLWGGSGTPGNMDGQESTDPIAAR